MKTAILMGCVLLAAGMMMGCSPSSENKPTSGAYQLKPQELSEVNAAASKFFASKIMVVDGKSYQGESLGCMGSDSDRDLNVTCTGNQPDIQGGVVMMREREILCNYAGAAAGCKKKA